MTLIDLRLLGIPGDEIARRMKEIDPSLKTVLITGLIPEDGDARLSPFDFQLQKLFRVAEIRNLVEKAVARRFVDRGSSLIFRGSRKYLIYPSM